MNPKRSAMQPTANPVLGPTSKPPKRRGKPLNLVMGPGKLGSNDVTKLKATNIAATAIRKADVLVFMARDFASVLKNPATQGCISFAHVEKEKRCQIEMVGSTVEV